MRPIPLGTAHTSTLLVTEAHTARVLGSGDLPVLGTPALIALMEQAAMQAIAPLLDPGESSVGIAIDATHDRPTAVGDTITATAAVTRIDGRRIAFELQAADSRGETIGQGKHTRFVVDVQKFMARIGK